MTKHPKISIIIPVYNAQDYLKECLDSVVSQSLKDIEIICVDDSSIDESLHILREYEQKDSRIIILQQKNSGAGSARNYGLQVATGEYIHFLDADDFLADNEVYKDVYEEASKNDVDILRTKAYLIDSITKEVKTTPFYELSNVQEEKFKTITCFLQDIEIFTHIPVVPWGGLFKRTFLIDNNILFPQLICVNDRSHFFESVFKAHKIMLVNRHIIYYRVQNSASLIGNRAKHFECHFKSYNFIDAYSKHFDQAVRKRILEIELYDIIHWIEKFYNTAYREEIFFETYNFLNMMDKSVWEDNIEKTSWYRKLNKLMGKYLTQPPAIVPEENNPIISVIMPVYNAQKYLEQTIRSVLEQSFKSFELICIDDGSTDKSIEIIKAFKKWDNRIILLKQKNQYAGVARNNGIKKSRGNYITFLDSDDIMLPNTLNVFYKKMLKTEADIILSPSYVFSEDTNQKDFAEWTLRKKYILKDNIFSAKTHGKLLFQITSGEPWGKCFKADFIKGNNIEFAQTPRSEDFYFVFWAIAIAKKITAVKEYTIMYRKTEGNGSLEDNKDKYINSFIEVRELLYNKLNNIGIYTELEQTFINSVIDGVAYNLRSFKTLEAFISVCNLFKESIVKKYDIDLSNEDYFINKYNYNFINKLYSYNDLEILFNEIKKEMKSKRKRVISNSGNSEDIKALQYKLQIKQQELNIYKNELNEVYNSWTYKIGRAVTFIPRKLRGGIKCLQEHGIKYTVKRLFQQMRIID